MTSLGKKYQRTTFCSVFFVAIMLGLGAAKFSDTRMDVSFLLLSVLIVPCVINKRSIGMLAAVFLCGFVGGWWRGGVFLQKVAAYTMYEDVKVAVRVRADTSGVYGKNSQLEFEATHIELLQPQELSLPGKMTISGYGENSILRGDTVLVEGKLYKRRGSKIAGISYGKIEAIQRSSSALEALRRNFLAGLATSLPEPHDQFAAGLLVGQRSELDEDVTSTLRTVGLSHIIAVSGYNLTILAEFARKRFGKKSQFRKAFFSICFVLGFVAVAGSSASISRAAMVSLLTIIAAYYGRSFKPHMLLLFVASITAVLNPLNIWSDVGWYLSFLAFFGVLIIAPIWTKRLYKQKEPKLIAKLVIETVAAQIATLPLILFLFGELSTVSLLANVLVVPFVPLAMLLSFVAGLAGMLAPTYALLLGWPARVLLDFMLSVSAVLARIPHAFVHSNLPAWGMLFLYGVILLSIVVMQKKIKKNGILLKS
jgi:competence protein ComEC